MIVVFSIKPDYLPDGDPECKMGVYNENPECLEHEGTKFWKLTSGKDVVYFTKCMPDIDEEHYIAKDRVEDKQELLGIGKEEEVYYFFHDHEISNPYTNRGEIIKDGKCLKHYHVHFLKLTNNIFIFQHTSAFYEGIIKCENIKELLERIKQIINGSN